MDADFTGIGMHVNGRSSFNADIRDYARWEYGHNDVAWLYSLAAQRRSRKRGLGRRVGAMIRGFARILAVPAPENRPR